MNRSQAIWFLHRGASVKHVGWEEHESVRLLYGFVATSSGRVFGEDEFFTAYGYPYLYEGWLLSDPFHNMAVKTLGPRADEIRVRVAEEDFRSAAMRELCGMDAYPDECSRMHGELWYGEIPLHRIVDMFDNDYIQGYLFSDACVTEFIERLVSYGILPKSHYLKSVPYMPKMLI